MSGPLLAALADRRDGILTYGITPPKRSWTPERVQEVARAQSARMASLPIDGVVVYDLQDESARTDVPRPFPYEECVDPVDYAYDHLSAVEVPRIVYRCVGKLDQPALERSLGRIEEEGGACVLVGAASADQDVRMPLPDAYALRRKAWDGLATGGVLIGERHRRRHAEHERVLAKVEEGCSFFITQAVYSATDTLDVLSDLHLTCREREIPVPPVIVTLTPCGSERTLTFLRWLGVAVPRWLENELLHAPDTLATSVEVCAAVFDELQTYARGRGIPLGCNVESVSLRREEIEASVDLVHRVAAIMGRTG